MHARTLRHTLTDTQLTYSFTHLLKGKPLASGGHSETRPIRILKKFAFTAGLIIGSLNRFIRSSDWFRG